MKKDKFKTKVIFLIEDDGDILAFFTEAHENSQGLPKGDFYTCYAHVGQHNACNIWYAKGLKTAAPEQYKDLAAELESEGYNLEILTNL